MDKHVGRGSPKKVQMNLVKDMDKMSVNSIFWRMIEIDGNNVLSLTPHKQDKNTKMMMIIGIFMN